MRTFARTEAYETRDGGKGKLRKPLPPHGTKARYCHKVEPCRCDDCKAANAAEARKSKAKRKQRESMYKLPRFSSIFSNTGSRDYDLDMAMTREEIMEYRK